MATNPPSDSELQSVASEVAEVAGVAAGIAPLAGPYGVMASAALSIIQVLATEAPGAYALVASAFDGTTKTAADFEALRAQVAALSLDS